MTQSEIEFWDNDDIQESKIGKAFEFLSGCYRVLTTKFNFK